jgi:hypothetical protein
VRSTGGRERHHNHDLLPERWQGAHRVGRSRYGAVLLCIRLSYAAPERFGKIVLTLRVIVTSESSVPDGLYVWGASSHLPLDSLPTLAPHQFFDES